MIILGSGLARWLYAVTNVSCSKASSGVVKNVGGVTHLETSDGSVFSDVQINKKNKNNNKNKYLIFIIYEFESY